MLDDLDYADLAALLARPEQWTSGEGIGHDCSVTTSVGKVGGGTVGTLIGMSGRTSRGMCVALPHSRRY